MDPRLLKYYDRELRFAREMGAEFAREFPKIAGRLGIEGLECVDPYVERLLEGFAFLAARIHVRLDAEFPRFTRHLLGMVYPHYVAPLPSMGVVQLQPNLAEGALADGYTVPRDTVLRSPLGKGEQTACEYRTAHDVTLWPLEVGEAEFLSYSKDLSAIGTVGGREVKAGLRIRLRSTAGVTLNKLSVETLPLFLRGTGGLPMRVYEQILAHGAGILIRPVTRPHPWQVVLDRGMIRRSGFEDDRALLPYGNRSFSGYRLLEEYFALPERYLFLELSGLAQGLRRCQEPEADVYILLDHVDPSLQGVIDASSFSLFCTPAVNLFPMRIDTIHLTESEHEYNVVPDRTRPLDFEIWDLTEVAGIGANVGMETPFLPFYARRDRMDPDRHRTYYTVDRVPRLLSATERARGTRSTYVGSEVFISLVDGDEAPHAGDLRQLRLQARCTNRDLPLHLSVGLGRTDLALQSGAPVEAVRFVAGPTAPRPSRAEGKTAWHLISHLTLNHFSLQDSGDSQGAVALGELLALYGGEDDAAHRKQVEGLRSVTTRPVHRRVAAMGPISWSRGIEISLDFEESAFAGSGPFLLGAVLEEFFARFVSLNSFTETVVRTRDRGELIRWPARPGRRHTL